MEDGGWRKMARGNVGKGGGNRRNMAYHINIYIYHFLAFLGNMFYLNPHRSGLEPAITAATAPQRSASRARQIPPGIIAEFVRQLAVAPCARQGYCMASKTKAEAIACHSCLI